MTPSTQREENRITKLAIWHSGSVSLSCQFLVAIYFRDFFFFFIIIMLFFSQAGGIQIRGFILRTQITHVEGTAPKGKD